MLELVPEGFEERERGDEVELAAYTDGHGGARIARAFGTVREDGVPADWRERWRAFHRPVRAGPFWVGPSWEGAPSDAVAIVIDPGLAFGTGAHATTRLCLELLADEEPGSLVDLGCGSGVLAVAAAKLGFAPVRAYDDDPFAVETTHRNATANDVVVSAERADVTTAELAADVAVANIALETVEAAAAQLDVLRLITSGYLEGDRPRLARFGHARRAATDGWAADAWVRQM